MKPIFLPNPLTPFPDSHVPRREGEIFNVDSPPLPKLRERGSGGDGVGVGSLVTLFLLLFMVKTPAFARPEYAAKEQKACQYCHISLSPGFRDPMTGKREPTSRNGRGAYYGDHDHSFQGYQEVVVMGKQSPPIFHYAWKFVFTDLPRRTSVADVTGSGHPQLITLNERPGKPEQSILSIKKWTGKDFELISAKDVSSSPDKLAVGRFAGKDHAAVIITPDALWYWKGSALVRKPASKTLALLGSTRLKDGEERVLLLENSAVRAYRVSLTADTNWLIDGIPSPASDQVVWGDMHAKPEELTGMGMPPPLSTGGLIGLWDARKFGKLFIYDAFTDNDVDLKINPKDPNHPDLVLTSRSCYVHFRDPKDQTYKVLWTTPRMRGVVYDIGLENPQGDGAVGLMVLISESKDGKGRTLYFFALD